MGGAKNKNKKEAVNAAPKRSPEELRYPLFDREPFPFLSILQEIMQESVATRLDPTRDDATGR